MSAAEYRHDANGNMITRTWQGPLQTLSYDHENWLVAVDGPVTATLGYDGQGNRVIRRMKGETRLYLDDWFETDTRFSHVRHYHLNGQRVAQRTSSGVTCLHGDHQGSTAEPLSLGAALGRGHRAVRWLTGAAGGGRSDSVVGLSRPGARQHASATH